MLSMLLLKDFFTNRLASFARRFFLKRKPTAKACLSC